MISDHTHESYERDNADAPGSERSFGLVMATAFALLGLLNGWHAGRAWPWLAGGAALFAATALIYPRMLRHLNWLWFKFGLLLHKIVSPIVMAFLFFVTITPIGFIMRARGKDLLRLKREPELDSYWIKRDPPGPAPGSMKDQF
jgi:hypothetical protein